VPRLHRSSLAFSTGFVSMSASMSLVFTYAISASLRATRSRAEWYTTSMCFDRLDTTGFFTSLRARTDAKVAYVQTNDMLADMLTMPVEKAKLDLCNRGIGYGPKPNTLATA